LKNNQSEIKPGYPANLPPSRAREGENEKQSKNQSRLNPPGVAKKRVLAHEA
jgi:hypothetical protein